MTSSGRSLHGPSGTRLDMSAPVARRGQGLVAVGTGGLPGVGCGVLAEGVSTAVASTADSADQTTGHIHHAEIRRVGCCVMNGTVSEKAAGLKGQPAG